jgi:putative redox protein
VSEKHLARAISLSAEKYCSVALMLDKTVDITHSHEIISQ